jgi:riboflavin kinase/FMN adenylyltransferase
LYDEEIAVSILQYIRPEQKFKSVDLLKVQLEKDKNFALAYLS